MWETVYEMHRPIYGIGDAMCDIALTLIPAIYICFRIVRKIKDKSKITIGNVIWTIVLIIWIYSGIDSRINIINEN